MLVVAVLAAREDNAISMHRSSPQLRATGVLGGTGISLPALCDCVFAFLDPTFMPVIQSEPLQICAWPRQLSHPCHCTGQAYHGVYTQHLEFTI